MLIACLARNSCLDPILPENASPMATTTATKPAVAAKASKTARAKKMSPRSNRSLDRPVPGTMTAAKGGAPSPTATAAATPTIATKQPTAAQAKASDIRRYRDLANSFKLLADGTRLGILDMIAGGPKNATKFDAVNRDGTVIFHGTVGTSAADLILDNVSIATGQTVTITAATYTAPV